MGRESGREIGRESWREDRRESGREFGRDSQTKPLPKKITQGLCQNNFTRKSA